MSIWAWIEEICPEGSNLIVIGWWLPSLHGHSPSPRGPIDLDSFSRASAYKALGAGLFKFLHSGPKLWSFENGFTKSVRKASILIQIWWLLYLNGHNSDPRVWFSLQLKFNSLGLDSEEGRLVSYTYEILSDLVYSILLYNFWHIAKFDTIVYFLSNTTFAQLT